MLSKNKSEILGLFFTNPDKPYYTGEIGRILNKKPGVFQRSLESMIKEGILQSEYVGNLRFFRLNKSYPFYDELKSIIFKTTGFAGSIKNNLKKMKNIIFAFIYGSFAEKKEYYASDIDLFIIGKPNENKLIIVIDKLEKNFGREINYKLLELNKLKKYVNERDPFILNVLNSKKIMLIGDENELRKIIAGKSNKKTNP